MSLFERSGALFRDAQQSIIAAIESYEHARKGASFERDEWSREGDSEGPIKGGGGLTCVIEGGEVFERGGVNFSAVRGEFPPEMAAEMPGEGCDFEACGISLVLHPRNPHIPTVHMNHRRLSRGRTGWFGGGVDLTPYYLDEADTRHFHRVLKGACDRHPSVADHASFKAACDAYFRNHHRDEGRGVGGTFFDYLSENPEETFCFIRDSLGCFVDAYLPIVDKHIDEPFSEQERDWQLLRRGRYVEFNLIHDRGTTFGLRTGGRTESILMSLPPEVSWRYDSHPEPGSREATLVDALRTPREWV